MGNTLEEEGSILIRRFCKGRVPHKPDSVPTKVGAIIHLGIRSPLLSSDTHILRLRYGPRFVA